MIRDIVVIGLMTLEDLPTHFVGEAGDLFDNNSGDFEMLPNAIRLMVEMMDGLRIGDMSLSHISEPSKEK
ncbi:MAG: hypothetical protein JW908_04680 [Anaerolineales bacterium]|nr:hypothetical protein [Anaerolineales bacterium]